MKNHETSTEEINQLSMRHPGIARIGARAEQEHRAKHPETADQEVAEHADELATEAIRNFLEDRDEGVGVPLTQNELPQGVEGLTRVLGVLCARDEAVGEPSYLGVAKTSSVSEVLASSKNEQTTEDKGKEALRGEDVFGYIRLEDGSTKRVLATEYKNGLKIEYSYDSRGRLVEKVTHSVDGVVETVRTFFGEGGSSVTETSAPYEEDGVRGERIIIQRDDEAFYLFQTRAGKKSRKIAARRRPVVMIDTGRKCAMRQLLEDGQKAVFPEDDNWPSLGEQRGLSAEPTVGLNYDALNKGSMPADEPRIPTILRHEHSRIDSYAIRRFPNRHIRKISLALLSQGSSSKHFARYFHATM